MERFHAGMVVPVPLDAAGVGMPQAASPGTDNRQGEADTLGAELRCVCMLPRQQVELKTAVATILSPLECYHVDTLSWVDGLGGGA